MFRTVFFLTFLTGQYACACDTLGPISEPNEPFRREAAAGCVENLRILIKFPGLNVNGTNSSDQTALILAAEKNQGEAVAYLVAEALADTNLQDQSGNSALHYGAQNGSARIVETLLANERTNLNLRNRHGQSALELAIHSHVQGAWQPLLKDPRLDKNLGAPLHLAAALGDTNLVSQMLANGWDVNDLGGSFGTTILRIAARNGYTELVQGLLSQPSIDVNRGSADYPILSEAVRKERNLPVIQLLLAHPDIQVNSAKNSPLAVAAGLREDNFQYIQALLRHPRIDPQPGLVAQFEVVARESWPEFTLLPSPGIRALDLLIRQSRSRPAEVGAHGLALSRWALRSQAYPIFAAIANHPSVEPKDVPALAEAAVTFGRPEDFKLVGQLPFFQPNQPGMLLLAAENAGRNIYRNGELVLPGAGASIFNSLISLAGVNLNQTDTAGFTALMKLAGLPRDLNSASWLALLRRPDLDVNLASKSGHTALSLLLCQELTWDEDKRDQSVKARALLADKRLDLARSGPALTCAIKYGVKEITLQLLKSPTAPGDLNTLTDGQTPLMRVIKNKDKALLAVVIQNKDLDPNVLDAQGFTALHQAIEAGDLDTVKLLLKHPRIDLNAQKPGRGPAFGWVKYPEQRAILLAMLAHPAIADSLKPRAESLLAAAIAAGDFEVFDRIQAFHFADPSAGLNLITAVRAQQLGMVDKLLKLGANVNQRTSDGYTPLIAAAEVGHRGISERLLAEPGIDYRARNEHNYDALFMAVNKKHEALALRLLNLPGWDLNARAHPYGDVPDATLLFTAVQNYLPEVVVALLKFPVDVNAAAKKYDGTPLYPLNSAIQFDFLDIAEVLLQHPNINAGILENGGSTLMDLVRQPDSNPTHVRALLAKGAPLNLQDPKKKETALMMAIHYARTDLSLALAQAPGLDRGLTDSTQHTLLHFAASAKDQGVMELLVKDASLPVNAINNSGYTPLFSATFANNDRGILLLGTRGDLNPNCVDRYNGLTPLIIAAKEGLLPATRALLQLRGINLEWKDKNGLTALMWAVKNGHHEVVKLLQNAGAKR